MNHPDAFDDPRWVVPPESRVLPAYRTPYPGRTWDDESWVRSKPHRGGGLDKGLPLFPRYLVPVLEHPAVATLGAGVERDLLAHHLLRYLDFTDWVELSLVNETAARLARRDFISWLPKGFRHDALWVYTDEAGHSEFSHELLLRVEESTGVTASAVPPAAEAVLAGSLEGAVPELRPLVRLFWTVTTETLITGNLSRASRDHGLAAPVRAVLADHAADEARHHLYFTELFRAVWPSLTPEGRRIAALEVAKAVPAYLGVDVPWLTDVLCSVAGARVDAASVAREVAADPAVRSGVRRAAAPTLKLLASAGAYADPDVADAFRSAGLF